MTEDRVGGGLAAIAVVSLAGMAAALVSQHLFDMQPCPWCVLQRLILSAIAALGLMGTLWRAAVPRRAVIALIALLSLGGSAAALWQHFKAAASASCNLTLADKIVSGLHLDSAIPDVFEARASCADAAVSLWGIPYDFWSLALFALIAVAATRLLRRR